MIEPVEVAKMSIIVKSDCIVCPNQVALSMFIKFDIQKDLNKDPKAGKDCFSNWFQGNSLQKRLW